MGDTNRVPACFSVAMFLSVTRSGVTRSGVLRRGAHTPPPPAPPNVNGASDDQTLAEELAGAVAAGPPGR